MRIAGVFFRTIMFRFIDAHTHAQFAAYDADRDEVVARAHVAGVMMVNVGTNAETSEAAVRMTEKYQGGVYATVGLHPIHVNESYHDSQESGAPFSNSRELENGNVESFTDRGEIFDHDYYKKLALDPKVVAIGECGLDYFRADSEKLNVASKKQKEVFLKHIELAHEVKKPLMIHCRSAFPDLIQLLTFNHKLLISVPGIIHFFSGTKEDAKNLLDLGFCFTFGGVITFARDYDEVVRYIPSDRILSETDAPYVTPAPYRGKRNEPAYVVEVVKKLAELKNLPLDEMAEQILATARRIFSNPDL